MTALAMDEHLKRVEALGIAKSSYNYINQLWKLHCRDVVGIDFMSTDFEDAVDALSEPEAPLSLDGENPLSAILNAINSELDTLEPDRINQCQSWLEKQLMALKRIKSDIELRLRNISLTAWE
ncbi:MAG: hypothetical protein VXX91_07970 [Planctomycetota bacterium]|nr:hypothetical protein [Planctomycetota bacterium]